MFGGYQSDPSHVSPLIKYCVKVNLGLMRLTITGVLSITAAWLEFIPYIVYNFDLHHYFCSIKAKSLTASGGKLSTQGNTQANYKSLAIRNGKKKE